MICSGCGKGLPDGFPKTYPMTVTVTNGTTPIPDARVMFIPETGGVGYAIGGTTDQAGVAKIRTAQGDHDAAGIPEGQFVVTVQDVINIDLGVTPEESAKLPRDEQNKLSTKRREMVKNYPRKVPQVLCRDGVVANRSPIRFTAKTEANELSIDVSQYEK